jgi:hypothetical protein
VWQTIQESGEQSGTFIEPDCSNWFWKVSVERWQKKGKPNKWKEKRREDKGKGNLLAFGMLAWLGRGIR